MKNDMYGITRLNYARTGKGWWIRLHYVDRTPTIQETVLDKENGGKKKALAVAMILRDKFIKQLRVEGHKVFGRKYHPALTSMNKTGITGLTYVESKRWVNGDYYIHWRVTWSELQIGGRKIISKTFAIQNYTSSREAFYDAVTHRHDMEVMVYGYSLIDLTKLEMYFIAAKRKLRMAA